MGELPPSTLLLFPHATIDCFFLNSVIHTFPSIIIQDVDRRIPPYLLIKYIRTGDVAT